MCAFVVLFLAIAVDNSQAKRILWAVGVLVLALALWRAWGVHLFDLSNVSAI